MLTIILSVVLFWLACKILAIGIRVTWGIEKILLPLLIVIGLVYIGLIYFSVPILVIFGAIFIVCHFIKVRNN